MLYIRALQDSQAGASDVIQHVFGPRVPDQASPVGRAPVDRRRRSADRRNRPG
jgi:hypothetical protein